MKLYQALKLKNKLAGKVTELQKTISAKNSRIVGGTNLFNLDNLLKELYLTKQNLIELKSAIAAANTPIQNKIYEIAEIKGEVKFWNGVSTKSGKETDRFSREVYEYEAHFNELQVSERTKELEKQIEKLQEELDSFNHQTSISTLSFTVVD